jgi:hypothetical protein
MLITSEIFFKGATLSTIYEIKSSMGFKVFFKPPYNFFIVALNNTANDNILLTLYLKRVQNLEYVYWNAECSIEDLIVRLQLEALHFSIILLENNFR